MNEATNSRLSVLDRSIVVLLPHPDDTPSARCGVSPSTERLHRLHGTSLLATAWKLLPQEQEQKPFAASCYATACTLFHRFYHCESLTNKNVWSVAMAASFLAAKLDSHFDLALPRVVLVFSHLYKRRRRVHQQQQVDQQEEQQKKTLPQPSGQLSPMGPYYKEFYDAVIETENQILHKLGFVLYWIPDQHAHKYLSPFLNQLSLKGVQHETNDNGSQQQQQQQLSKTVGQRAWNYCNDSYRLDLCTRYESHVIACAAIHLACLDCNYYTTCQQQQQQQQQQETCKRMDNDSSTTKGVVAWWEFLCGSSGTANMTKSTISLDVCTICNALLGLQQNDNDKQQQQQQQQNHQQRDYDSIWVASNSFVPSLEPQGSFNDPGSFLWEMLEDNSATSPSTKQATD